LADLIPTLERSSWIAVLSLMLLHWKWAPGLVVKCGAIVTVSEVLLPETEPRKEKRRERKRRSKDTSDGLMLKEVLSIALLTLIRTFSLSLLWCLNERHS
jgi:hypothetical protein